MNFLFNFVESGNGITMLNIHNLCKLYERLHIKCDRGFRSFCVEVFILAKAGETFERVC